MANKNDNLIKVAEVLYVNQGMSLTDIAKQIGKSRVTLTKWCDKHNWKELKVNLVTERRKRLNELYMELAELNRKISEREGYKVADNKEADIRRKLIADIKDMEDSFSISQLVTIAQDYCEFIKEIDYDFAEKTAAFMDEFITHTINQQKWQNK